MQEAKSNPVRTVLYFSLLLAAGAYLCQPIFEPNFFGDLALGHQIFANHKLPHTDILTHLGADQAWFEPRWGLIELTAKIELMFGEPGLIVLRMLSVAILLLGLGQVLLRLTGDGVFAGILALLTAVGLMVYPGGMLSALPLALFVLCLGGMFCLLQTARPKPVLALLFLLLVLLSNFDAALFLWMLMFAAAMVWPRADRRQKIQLSSLALAASLANPFLGRQLLSAGRLLAADFQTGLIFRMHQPSVFYFDVAALIVLALLLGLCAHFRLTFLKRGEVLLVAVLLLLAAASRTFVPQALLATALVLATLWGRAAGTGFGNLSEAIRRLSGVLRAVSATGLIWVLWCLLIVSVAKQYAQPMLTVMLPEKELDAVVALKRQPKILHSAEIGSYVAYRLLPLGGRALLNESSRAFDPMFYFQLRQLFEARPGWREFLNDQDPEFVLANTLDPLAQVLELDSSWRELNAQESQPNYAHPWRVFVRQNP